MDPGGYIQPLIKWVKEEILWEPKADHSIKISAMGQNNSGGNNS
jgi:hypothetical protein